MQLPELINLLSQSLPDPGLLKQYLGQDGHVLKGEAADQVPEPDGLWRFVANELEETHDSSASDNAQILTAFNVLSRISAEMSAITEAARLAWIRSS